MQENIQQYYSQKVAEISKHSPEKQEDEFEQISDELDEVIKIINEQYNKLSLKLMIDFYNKEIRHYQYSYSQEDPIYRCYCFPADYEDACEQEIIVNFDKEGGFECTLKSAMDDLGEDDTKFKLLPNMSEATEWEINIVIPERAKSAKSVYQNLCKQAIIKKQMSDRLGRLIENKSFPRKIAFEVFQTIVNTIYTSVAIDRSK